MKTTFSLVLLGSLLLSGCQVGGRPASHLLDEPLAQCPDSGHLPPQGCITQCRDPMNKACPALKYVPPKVDEIKLTQEPAPLLGLTLSGGGSKAAPFAMGVLKRFVDEGWIYKTQYLTSVSGGGYAAFYLYYRAYRAIMAEDEKQNPTEPKITPPEVPVQNDERWTGLQRYFVDARNATDPEFTPPYLTLYSSDLTKNGPPTPYSLASNIKGCLTLTTLAANALPNELPEMWKNQYQEIYQGWVECYQDLLMTHPAKGDTAKIDDTEVAEDFALLFVESAAAAPAHYVANILFDWKKPLSPTQYDYLYGIERTYAYFPTPGETLPRHLHDEVFRQIANCLDFKDIAEIYLADPEKIHTAVGGILPKWILEATGTNGNVGLNFSPQHYDLSQDVFEISMDEYGSGRFGYVKGAPSIIGLTVPYAVLASAAFADTAQRNIAVPRGVVDVAIQTFNVKWGFDVPNYNVSNAHRIVHSFLVWPFYYVDDPTNPYTEQASHAPTIHLSDGGQSGDNLGLISMFRRGVKNIVVAAGEDDVHYGKHDADGWLDMGSLCAANYYLIQRGFTLRFDADPRTSGPATNGTPYNLAEHCTWDGNRQVYIHPDKDDPSKNITPFNWARRVWVGTVVQYDKPPFPMSDQSNHPELPRPQEAWTPENEIPPGLEGIKVYYLNAALDRARWVSLSTDWSPGDLTLLNFKPFPSYLFALPNGAAQRPWSGEEWSLLEAWYPAPAAMTTVMPLREWHCDGEMVAMEGDSSHPMKKNVYSCPLLGYVYATNAAVMNNKMQWRFPQTSTWFTTFDNSINLFRAYRDLGWEYAGALADLNDNDLDSALTAAENALPEKFRSEFPSATTVYRDPDICKGWVGAPKRTEEAPTNMTSLSQ